MDSAAVMGRAAGENFPVASRVLPRRLRRHLLALYGFARLVDELGDSAPPRAADAAAKQQRLAALDELERDLDRAYAGGAEHPLLRRLEPTLRECNLPRAPFARLIEANRVDQRVSSYATWEQLRAYCELSANPVGELVLDVFGAATPARVALSDAICTALQLAEHCQDVAEDRARGRVYLPAEDLERFGCGLTELSGERARAPLRAVLAFETRRARELLAQGAPLIDELRGIRERLAVAAFVAGGRAALDAIERADFDVLAGPPRAGTARRLLALGATLAERRRPSLGGRAGLQPSVAEAYSRCEALTRRSAANFYYGIRLLPLRRRQAMCAVYAFARRIDDIGDGALGREEKVRGLDAQARALAWLPGGAVNGAAPPPQGAPTDPVMVALADAYARFAVPPDALRALIEGVRMDVEGTTYQTFDDLVLYCRRVAGAIGRACLAIFALRDPDDGEQGHAAQLADDLGVALQLTNILRDVREDADNGRMYLPADDLRRFGLIAAGEERQAPATIAALARAAAAQLNRDGAAARAPAQTSGPPSEGAEPQTGWLCALIRFEAERARVWFERSIVLTSLLDRRSAACVLAMANIYRRLLDQVEAEPRRALGERLALAPHEKAWVAAQSVLGGLGNGHG